MLKQIECSGLSVAAFATRHGLDTQRLYRWRTQLGGDGAMTAPAFVEIKQTGSAAIEVVLRSGHVLRVPDGFGEDTLQRVIAALESPVGSC